MTGVISPKMDTWKLLWTNASPTSAFEAQTVALDLIGYDAVLISAGAANDQPFGANFICFVGSGIYMDIFVPDIVSKYNRAANVTSSGIVFGAGYYGTKVNNICVIPLAVHGIKGASH